MRGAYPVAGEDVFSLCCSWFLYSVRSSELGGEGVGRGEVSGGEGRGGMG